MSEALPTVRCTTEIVNRRSSTESEVPRVLIDCDTCRMRDIACGDCVISLLLGAPEDSNDLDEVEAAAFGALAAGGLVPPLRLVPVRRTSGLDLAWPPGGPVPGQGPGPRSVDPASPATKRPTPDHNRLRPAASGP